jgi:hypothetical protein
MIGTLGFASKTLISEVEDAHQRLKLKCQAFTL